MYTICILYDKERIKGLFDRGLLHVCAGSVVAEGSNFRQKGSSEGRFRMGSVGAEDKNIKVFVPDF